MKTVDFLETFTACDLKVGKCRQLIKVMKVCELKVKVISLPRFSRFCALLSQEGERLQDHWSSGLSI